MKYITSLHLNAVKQKIIIFAQTEPEGQITKQKF